MLGMTDEPTEFVKKIEELRRKRSRTSGITAAITLCESKDRSGIPLMPSLRAPRGSDGDDETDDERPEVSGDQEEEEEFTCHPCEEAPKPVTGRDPRCPTPQERAEHDLTHLPFRSGQT